MTPVVQTRFLSVAIAVFLADRRSRARRGPLGGGARRNAWPGVSSPGWANPLGAVGDNCCRVWAAARRFHIRFRGAGSAGPSERQTATAARGTAMAMIFQEPMTSLNPAYSHRIATVGRCRTPSFGPRAGRPWTERSELLTRVGSTASGDAPRGNNPISLSAAAAKRVYDVQGVMCVGVADRRQPTNRPSMGRCRRTASAAAAEADMQELGLAWPVDHRMISVWWRAGEACLGDVCGEVVETDGGEVFAAPTIYTRGLLGTHFQYRQDTDGASPVGSFRAWYAHTA